MTVFYPRYLLKKLKNRLPYACDGRHEMIGQIISLERNMSASDPALCTPECLCCLGDKGEKKGL